MQKPTSHFIAYMTDSNEKGYLYAMIDNKHYRIVSPTTEDSYVVPFESYEEMMSDIDAFKHIRDDLICINSIDFTPFNNEAVSNLSSMLSTQGRLLI